MPKPTTNPADRLIQHLRDGDDLYLRLASADPRWALLRASLLVLEKTKKKSIIARLAIDALRVQITQRLTPETIALLGLDAPPTPNSERPS